MFVTNVSQRANVVTHAHSLPFSSQLLLAASGSWSVGRTLCTLVATLAG